MTERFSAGSGGRPLDIGVVTPVPTPYRDPFWNAVAEQPGVRLSVYYCASTTPDRPWSPDWHMRYRAEFLAGFNVLSLFPSQGFAFWNPRAVERLREGRHDALIIGGYSYPTMLAAIRFARRRGIPYFLMSESHLKEPRAAWRRLVKRHRKLRGASTVGPHPARPVPAVAPRDPSRSADACRSAIGRPILYAEPGHQCRYRPLQAKHLQTFAQTPDSPLCERIHDPLPPAGVAGRRRGKWIAAAGRPVRELPAARAHWAIRQLGKI